MIKPLSYPLRLLALLFISQTILHDTSALPLNRDDVSRSKRSTSDRICARKAKLTQPSGTISTYMTTKDQQASCSWVIHAARGHHVELTFHALRVNDDQCPGICACNYVTIKEPDSRNKTPVSWKFCNERKPPVTLRIEKSTVKIHLHLRASNTTSNDGVTISYTTPTALDTAGVSTPELSTTGVTPTGEKEPRDRSTTGAGMIEARFHPVARHGFAAAQNGASETGEKKNDVAPTKSREQPTSEEDVKPSKTTILLGVAIPIVLIFLLVVLLIAYYNHLQDMKQQTTEAPATGTHIGDMIMTSGATLAPMINLRKAKKESSIRKEKANQLYDDMLQSWKATNENRKERLKAKQESVNVWESFQASKKSRRSSSRDTKEDSKAFAMLVSNAINVPTTDEEEEIEEQETVFDEEEEEVEEKPRPSSILVTRNLSEDTKKKRGSKVLSWCDISSKVKEKFSDKRATSVGDIAFTTKEAEPKPKSHIPAIVVSQPSVESEESEPIETERLIKADEDATQTETTVAEDEPAEPETDTITAYSCSEHVKDILRDSYGEELDWWKKPGKEGSQEKLKDAPDEKGAYAAMKAEEEEDID